MRKMKTPEMDVIRFDESDVIVASGGPVPVGTLRLTGFNSGSEIGKFAIGGGGTYTSSEAWGPEFVSELNSTFDSENRNISIYTSIGTMSPEGYFSGSALDMIISGDEQGHDVSGYDGDYSYNGTWFIKQ